MRRKLAKQLNCVSNHLIHPSRFLSRQFFSEGSEFSYGLNCALAGKGVIAKGKVFYNLKPSELKKTEQVYGVPLHVRGNTVAGFPDISKSQFSKLLKQVSCHLSSLNNIYVQDGTISNLQKCNCKVRVLSDNRSAVFSLSNILYKASIRDISHDSCPLTVYIASSISSNVKEILNNEVPAQREFNSGFAVADIERSALILCGKACADFGVVKYALAALASPVLAARGGIPLSARILVTGNSVNLLFASDEIINTTGDLQQALVSTDAGVILFSDSFAPLFHPNNSTDPKYPSKKLSSIIILSSDSTGGLQLISKLTAGQMAYHFLAGYNDGKFTPVYNKGPSPIDPLALANSIFFKIKELNIPCFLINANVAGKIMSGQDLIQLVTLALANKLPQIKLAPDSIVEDLKAKYNNFLSGKFKNLPEQFSF